LFLALGLLNRATLTFSVTTAMNGAIFNPIAQCGHAISAPTGTRVMGTILGVRGGPLVTARPVITSLHTLAGVELLKMHD
jgi:hypothetical protein